MVEQWEVWLACVGLVTVAAIGIELAWLERRI
jgi:hypothetical protein